MSTNDKGDKPPRGGISPEEYAELKKRSQGISKRLDQLVTRRSVKESRSTNGNRGVAYSKAFRIAAELIGGFVFGGVVGWSLDRLLGTTPIMLVIFVMLGFAAGLLNVIRGARKAQAELEHLQRGAPSVRDDKDDD